MFCLLFAPAPLLLPASFWESVLTVGRKPELDSWSAGLSEPRILAKHLGLGKASWGRASVNWPFPCVLWKRQADALLLGCSSLFVSTCSYVHFSLLQTWLCVVLIHRFSFRENACKVWNFENYTFNLKNLYVNVLQVF